MEPRRIDLGTFRARAAQYKLWNIDDTQRGPNTPNPLPVKFRNWIFEQEYALEKPELIFAKFTSCIGVAGRIVRMSGNVPQNLLSGVHLVQSYDFKWDNKGLVRNLIADIARIIDAPGKPAVEVIVFGCLDWWDMLSDFLNELYLRFGINGARADHIQPVDVQDGNWVITYQNGQINAKRATNFEQPVI